ncbi:MAG: N-acetylmuramoyl-L-alanine amidase [Elusimicrobia bacterium]|nr:N-acetylmuramoyl-L-alanine amidase [Elusimicrobiota bacterium]
MKRFLLPAAFLVLSAAAARLAAEEAAVVVSGKPVASAAVYRAGGEAYLDARSVGRALGGQVYWYPVSGRVRLSLRGRAMQFVADSARAESGGESFVLPAPVKVRASRAFLPVSFLVSKPFGRWSGTDAQWDDRTGTLEIDRRGDVGPVHVFSYDGHTRVVLELAPGVAYRAAPRGAGAVEATLPLGTIESADRAEVDDGVVASYQLKQETRQARLIIQFAAKGAHWRAAELSDPRGLAIDVYAPGVPELPPPSPQKRRVVVVDAGHGGQDPGATGRRGTREKDVNLAVALELSRVLRRRGDFEVVLTRDQDAFVPLSDRSDKANALNADLFVSLHCNAASSARKSGFEVYSVSETASDPEAERLAQAENAALKLEGKDPQDETAKLILLAMTKTEMLNESAPFAVLVERALDRYTDLENRGAKQAAFYVLRGTHAPAILVEMGFVSHRDDEAKLNSRAFRRRMAEGIAAGVADYARSKGWL